MSGESSNKTSNTKLVAARVRVTIDCPECACPVPVNGIVKQVLCGACQSVIELDDEFAWSELLTYASHESCMEHRILVNSKRVKAMDYFLAFGPKGGRLYRKYRQILLEVDAKPMACPGCKGELDLGAVGAELEAEGQAVDVFCPGCGASVPIRAAGKRERHAVHEACVGVACETALTGDLHAPETNETVMFSCMGCGAPLKVDGSAPRILPCEFCEATNFLPDALWLRLHPAQRKRPFWLLLASSQAVHSRAKGRL